MGQLFDFLVNHWMLSSALLTAVILFIAHEGKEKLLGIREIQPSEATHLINHKNAVLLDVRDEGQFKSGHIINAKHTPFAMLDDQIENYEEYKNAPLIVYCNNGQLSARACALLNKSGFHQLYKLAGGIMNWKNANFPLSKN